jgi:hypothetical protein
VYATYEECVETIMGAKEIEPSQDLDSKIKRFVGLCCDKRVNHDLFIQIVPEVLDYESIENFARYHNPPMSRLEYILDLYPIPNPLPYQINNLIMGTLLRDVRTANEIYDFLMRMPHRKLKLNFGCDLVRIVEKMLNGGLILSKFQDVVQLLVDMDIQYFANILHALFNQPDDFDTSYIEYVSDIIPQYNLDMYRLLQNNFADFLGKNNPTYIKILLDLFDPRVVALKTMTKRSKHSNTATEWKILVECAKRGVDISAILMENEDMF